MFKGIKTFSRDLRLTSDEQFKYIFRYGKVLVQKDTFKVYSCLNNKNHLRLGVIVPKRVVKKAVARNRIRRIVKEVVRLSQDKIEGKDLLFLLKEKVELDKRKLAEKIKEIIRLNFYDKKDSNSNNQELSIHN